MADESKKKSKLALSGKEVTQILAKFVAVVFLSGTILFSINGQLDIFLKNKKESGSYNLADYADGKYTEIYEKDVEADFLFIGTSHVTHGVTPEAFEESGHRFYNFAFNGAVPSYYLWWYNSVFLTSGYPKPKTIIIGVDWFAFDDTWLWRRPEYDFKYVRDEETAYTGAWYDLDAFEVYIMNKYSLFTDRERIFEMIGFSIEEVNVEMAQYYNGFIPFPPGAEHNGEFVAEVSTVNNFSEIEIFCNLIDQFINDGIEVIFIQVPENTPGRIVSQYDEQMEIIESIAAEREIPFFNYNSERHSYINEDYRYFSDWGHLNNEGAQEFSRMLYNDLKELIAG